ncbi:hypothetical protein J3R30DRAFT_3365536 [Lentinula aciculospora]|uniref:PB1 domain-containing protein n=1 Tax=Lentinula aciculospora TaxID=153920 RepID=A0A9W9DV79_9AGAR|nr:hypothetical protein J3R30DRAFT_3365536 [Lentinula aciculospora]
MAAAHFKLKLAQAGGPTRRLSFTDEPTWSLLAERIAGLFDIPAQSVAVAYIDSEDDEVTLSSQEELQDFYQTSYKPGDVVKFTVEDLRTPRRRARSSPTTPPASNLRNTFGASMSDSLPFNIDEDWQHFPPGLGGLFSANGGREDSSLHAFVEEIESGASTISGARNDETTSISDSDSHDSTVIPPRVDKGKARAQDIDASSTASLLESKTFEKPDVHVKPVEPVVVHRNSRRSSRRSSVAPISTPKAHVQDVPPFVPQAPITIPSAPPSTVASAVPSRPISVARTNETIPPTSIPVFTSESDTAEAVDPPLPALDSASLEHANPSLSVDVANLLNNLAAIVSTHPELSEGFRNILRNAAAGTYWSAQRDVMSQAADIARSVAEELNRADQEAGRRVSDALGLLFRTISQTLGTAPDAANGGPSTSRNPPPPSPPNADGLRWGFGPWGGRGPWGHHWHGPEFGPYSPPGSFFGRPPSGRPPFGPPGGHGMPPPSPPPHDMAGGPPPPPPAHARPPSPPGMPGPHGGRPSRFGHGRSYSGGFGHWGPTGPPPMDAEVRVRQASNELRNQVEAAKLLYKAEKERYRQDREQRRQERDRRMLEMMGDMSLQREQGVTRKITTSQPPEVPPSPPANPAATAGPSTPWGRGPRARIISNARGSFPQFELISVPSPPGPSAGPGPHRSHTLPARGHGHIRGGHHGHPDDRRHTSQLEDPATRAVNRINRKLADMGFSETAHPDLASKVRAVVPHDGILTRDNEDEIVTNLLEELVIRTKTPAAELITPGSRR